MADNGNNGVRLHKTMAVTGSYPHGGGNFGVKQLSEVNSGGAHPDCGKEGSMLADSARSARPNLGGGGGMARQAQPDHGPHHHKRA